MFEEGHIIYFDPFYFKNGNTPKPKYFVVLKNIDNQSVLASLPTRKDSIPEKEEIDHGCVELPVINLNCFVISNDIEVTITGKKFDFKTHIYGHQIESYDIAILEEIYPLKNTDFEIWGKMKDDLFLDLLECIKTSKTVKQKYRRILES